MIPPLFRSESFSWYDKIWSAAQEPIIVFIPSYLDPHPGLSELGHESDDDCE
jgi:hypothetical protein